LSIEALSSAAEDLIGLGRAGGRHAQEFSGHNQVERRINLFQRILSLASEVATMMGVGAASHMAADMTTELALHASIQRPLQAWRS
jgi:hypothetical protein